MSSLTALSLPSNFKDFLKPTDRCQVCLSSQQQADDYIITCEICRSAIHQTHYGSELLQNPIPETWYCQRCRFLLDSKSEETIKCSFCPNLRGIMKEYNFEKRKLWIHPECAAWPYPTLFFMNKKKEVLKKQKPKQEITYFWVQDYDSNPYPCSLCNQNEGLKIKCKYYDCKTSFHVPCGVKTGVIRDLESMRIELTGSYFPVYCREHIQKRILDYQKRSKMFRENNQIQKSRHFEKISYLFENQLKNLEQAKKKNQEEEAIIEKLVSYAQSKIQENQNKVDFEIDGDQSFSSSQSSNFLKFLEKNLISEDSLIFPIKQHFQCQDQQMQISVSRSFQNGHSFKMISFDLQNQRENHEDKTGQQPPSPPVEPPSKEKEQELIEYPDWNLQSDNSQLYNSNCSLGSFIEYYDKSKFYK